MLRHSVLALGLLASTAGHAGVIASTGGTQVIAAPPSVDYRQLEGDGVGFVFAEAQNRLLGAAVAVDANSPGEYRAQGDLLVGASLAAGTLLSSYYLHTDRVGDTGSVAATGSITFDSDILGVIGLDGSLLASDWLGAPGTLYPTANGRTFDLDANDWFSISADRRTLTYTGFTGPWSDGLRILVAVNAVPEPSALMLALLGLGLVGNTVRRRG